MMPRFDDRLANILELMRSGEHSDIDTIFRHVSDILLQDGVWMDADRRAAIVGHLADLYPKTTQPARMEVMDITARVADAAPEIVALAASDNSIEGTRLWDRVQLSRNDWDILLARLPKPILGRLRSRLDLADETVVSIDREWRSRVKNPAFMRYSLTETAEALKSGLFRPAEAPVSNEQAKLADDFEEIIAQERSILERAAFGDARPASKETSENAATTPITAASDANDTLGLADGESVADDSPGEKADEEDILELSEDDGAASLFLPSNEDDLTELTENEDDVAALDEVIDVSNVLDRANSSSEDDAYEAKDTQTLEPAQKADIIDLSRRRAANQAREEADVLSDANTEADADSMVDSADDLDIFALSDSPQVDDPKIQDILERLREFGSRSKRFVDPLDDTAEETEAQDAQIENALIDLASAATQGDEDDNVETQEPAIEDDGRRRSSMSLFLPDQPFDEDIETEEDALEDVDVPFISTGNDVPLHQPVTVNGNVWVTDRLGTLVECNTNQTEAFGVETDAAHGQILAALFDTQSAHTLNQALNARRPFRDISIQAASDGKTWMVSAVPVFDDASGIFLGHRGTAVSLSITALEAPQEGDDLPYSEQPGATATLDVASLAHELKTPLNAIRGFAEMIETQQLGPASDFARDRSKKIGQEADQLHQILGDLLLSNSREQASENNPKPIKSLLKNSTDPFETHLNIAGLDTLAPHLGARLDPSLLETVLEKMIHLSALWTPAGREIKVSVARDSQTSVSVHIPLAGWMGGSSVRDFNDLEAGPRLSYRHSLLQISFKGRGLQAIMEDINAAGARVFLRSAGRLEAALVLICPVE